MPKPSITLFDTRRQAQLNAQPAFGKAKKPEGIVKTVQETRRELLKTMAAKAEEAKTKKNKP